MKQKRLPISIAFALCILCFPFLLISCGDECSHPNIAETVIAPTCDQEGKTVHQCADCSFSYVTDIKPSYGHSLSASATEPTCSTEGYTDYSCACGYTYRSDYKKALGHEYEISATAPTCTTEGFTLYSCDCGYEYKGDFLKPLGHDYTVTVSFPTCTAEGYTDYSCDCGYEYRSDPVAPKGHSFQSTVTRPTVSTMGYTEYACSCGYEYTGDYTFYRDILENAYAGNSQVLAKGIDVSRYNHSVSASGAYLPINWTAIKSAGIDYAIIKAGSTLRQGGALGGMEPTFLMDYEGAKAAGLDVGVYFYTYSTTVQGMQADANALVAWLDGKEFEYPIYLDLEDDSLRFLTAAELTELCLSFCSILQANGYYAGVYTNQDWLINELETGSMLRLFEIWYARYPGSSNPTWNVDAYGEHLGMWQFSDQGSFEAIPDIVFDLNYAYKDYPSRIKELGLNGFTSE